MDIQIAARKFYDYSTYIRGYSPNTVKRYVSVVNYYCREGGITELEQVNEENVRNMFYNGRTEKNWTANTFITFHKSLVVFFRWCVDNGLMETNPAEKVETPKREKRIPPKLTKQQALRLLEVVYNYPYDYKFLRHRNYAMFATFIYAGLRKSELLHLKYADIDLENLTIFIRQGKGSKDRIVPMSYTLAEILKKYISERQRLNKTCPELFASLNRNMGFTDIGMKRLVEKMRKAAGIDFTVHRLRHSFAVLMLEGGCDIYSLSKIMGHADIKTTTIYLAASTEHLRKQIIKHPLN